VGVVVTQAVDQLAVAAQFRLHEEALRRFLYAMVRDRALAEDLVQDVFVEACRAPERLAAAEPPEAWLFTVARRRALNALRASSRFRAALTRLAGRREPDGPPADAELGVAFALLEALDAPTRALLLLRYVHGFSSPELAEITGRSPAAVRKQLERARATLLDRAGGEEMP
jgi:RNA polymerase sigma-70 factor (ECF subfamily)